MAGSIMGAGRKTTFGATRRRAYRPMSEINVTPFVDVMLVLLIVFMVTAPMLSVGVEVDLPETSDAAPLEGQDEPLQVTIQEGGEVYLNETGLPLENLVPRLRAILGEKQDTRIFVRGDEAVAYAGCCR